MKYAFVPVGAFTYSLVRLCLTLLHNYTTDARLEFAADFATQGAEAARDLGGVELPEAAQAAYKRCLRDEAVVLVEQSGCNYRSLLRTHYGLEACLLQNIDAERVAPVLTVCSAKTFPADWRILLGPLRTNMEQVLLEIMPPKEAAPLSACMAEGIADYLNAQRVDPVHRDATNADDLYRNTNDHVPVTVSLAVKNKCRELLPASYEL